MYQQLKKYVTDRVETDEQALQVIFAHFKLTKTKRNALLLTPGQVCKDYYFVNKGFIRLFTVNQAGEEGTRYFAFEGSFGTALPSLIDQQPAFEYIQTVEPSELLVINRESFYQLVETTKQFSLIYRQILEAAFITAQKRIYGFQGLEAIEKVRWLMEYQPKLLTRVSNKMVASYLGMTPATLSRLKSKL
ncbi:MAG: Crp/Fnr family transcriptional regulator [Ferruginibacter sp.]|nr:Crp/Fnr family transcriptional regulator [Cytophagales bacterium]